MSHQSLDSSRIEIRKALSKQIPEILSIERTSFEYPWDRDRFLEAISSDSHLFYVARATSSVLGYVVLLPSDISFLNVLRGNLSSMKNECHVLNIAVDPGHRRKGIGSFLMHRTYESTKKQGDESIRLETRVDNRTALKFYRHHGFQVVDRVVNYYKNGDDAFLMRKELEDPTSDQG